MITLAIPDMNCGHCRASVTAALAALPGATPNRIDAEARTVSIDGHAEPAAIIRALDGIGFPARLVG